MNVVILILTAVNAGLLFLTYRQAREASRKAVNVEKMLHLARRKGEDFPA